MTVQSIIQPSVTINSTGDLTIATNTVATANTLNSLSISGSGTLNVTNNQLYIVTDRIPTRRRPSANTWRADTTAGSGTDLESTRPRQQRTR
jgi:hypothetical protein